LRQEPISRGINGKRAFGLGEKDSSEDWKSSVMKLERILKSIAEKLAIDFKYMSSEIEHRVSKGRVREVELVAEFLNKYLPNSVGLSHGEIVATTGETSSECDVVVYDSQRCPVLLDKADFRIFPIECVYGVLEVTSVLSEGKLEEDARKIGKVKRLPKKAFEAQGGAIRNVTKLYDKEWEHFPAVGFIFAYDSADLVQLRNRLEEVQGDLPVNERVDSVWVLGKGMIVNWDDCTSKISHTPTKNTRLRAVASDNPLLLMVVHLQQLFQAVRMPTFKVQDYFGKVEYGKWLDE
jgi:hypothetical protein